MNRLALGGLVLLLMIAAPSCSNANPPETIMADKSVKIKDLPRGSDAQKTVYADLLERAKAAGLDENATQEQVVNEETK